MGPVTASLLVVMSLAPARVFAQQTQDRIPPAPEAFRHVAGELWNRRVVALADFARGSAYLFYTLTQVLTNWLDLAADKTVSLVLVLEEAGQTAEILQEYLRTGQTEPILNHLLPYTSLDRPEQADGRQNGRPGLPCAPGNEHGYETQFKEVSRWQENTAFRSGHGMSMRAPIPSGRRSDAALPLPAS